MKITIDTQTTEDPNIFGEVLREYAFVERYGCYTCFDLMPEFKELPIGSPIQMLLYDLLDIDEEYFNSKDIAYYSNGNLHLAWYWDGDGTLLILEGDRSAITYDCKKDYEWRWKENKIKGGDSS